ncbi:hypothetical protein WMY93_000275 [Mugilogobius chulae]|uniref:Uncharacterized protein n=1 Tax=Mugilogobius chulae TaxID=88201 RepID=A0AAW0Q9I7_9GOBI
MHLSSQLPGSFPPREGDVSSRPNLSVVDQVIGPLPSRLQPSLCAPDPHEPLWWWAHRRATARTRSSVSCWPGRGGPTLGKGPRSNPAQHSLRDSPPQAWLQFLVRAVAGGGDAGGGVRHGKPCQGGGKGPGT